MADLFSGPPLGPRRGGTPPQTPLNSTAFGHPWGPTTVPPAPKILSRARHLHAPSATTSASSSSQAAPASRDPFNSATQLSTRMSMAIHDDHPQASSTMQMDEDSHFHRHSAAFVAHPHGRRDSTSTGSLRSHGSTSDFFNPAISSSSSRSTLLDSPALSARSSNKAQHSSPPRHSAAAHMGSTSDLMHSSPLLHGLQPAFTPLPPRKSAHRERRGHSPNEPLDSDDEERLCLRFNPAMLHRSPDLQLVSHSPSLGLAIHAPVLAPLSQPVWSPVQPEPSSAQPMSQDSNMDIEDTAAGVTLAQDSPVEQAPAPAPQQLAVQPSLTPESPALRTRSRTRMAAAAAAAAASASAAQSRHGKSGSSSSIAHVPVRMSSLSTVPTLSQVQGQSSREEATSPASSSGNAATESSDNKQRNSKAGKNQLSVRTRRQAQREREEHGQKPHPQRHSVPRSKGPQNGAATMACAPTQQTASPQSSPNPALLSPSMRRKRNGRMRAFDPTPSPSPPPPNRMSLHGHPLGSRRSKSPSPYCSHSGPTVAMAAVAAAAAAAAAASGVASPADLALSSTLPSPVGDHHHHLHHHHLHHHQPECLNPTFPLPLSSSRNTHPRSQRPRRMSSRCSVRSSTPGMSPIPMPMTPSALAVPLPVSQQSTSGAQSPTSMHVGQGGSDGMEGVLLSPLGHHFAPYQTQQMAMDRDVAMEH
ncbi:hypothetical protein OC835_004966 [Tilletia horrida]|nr:hypothetical protein OC835_004966 [Tilletia horrida]